MNLTRIVAKNIRSKHEQHIILEDELSRFLVKENILPDYEAKEFATAFAGSLRPELADEGHRIDLAGHTYIDRHKLQVAIGVGLAYLEHWISDAFI